MWDLPGPGLEHVSPALAGGFSTTVPPGKSLLAFIFNFNFLAVLSGLWDLSALTRDSTRALGSDSMES